MAEFALMQHLRQLIKKNKDENGNRFALSALREELLERERGREKQKDRKRKRERDSFGILYTGYLLSIVKIKREIERDKEESERERKR